jgi:hypothetical protein
VKCEVKIENEKFHIVIASKSASREENCDAMDRDDVSTFSYYDVEKSLNCCSMLQNIGAFSASTHATNGD